MLEDNLHDEDDFACRIREELAPVVQNLTKQYILAKEKLSLQVKEQLDACLEEVQHLQQQKQNLCKNLTKQTFKVKKRVLTLTSRNHKISSYKAHQLERKMMAKTIKMLCKNREEASVKERLLSWASRMKKKKVESEE